MNFYVEYSCICETVTEVVECKDKEVAKEYNIEII